MNRDGAAAGGCAAEWAARFRDGAGVSRRRRAGGDAAPACGGAAGYEREDGQRRNAGCVPRLVEAERATARRCGDRLKELDGIDADDVIMTPDRARSRGLTATVCFPVGNLAPEGAVIKSTAIDPSLIDEDNVYRHRGPARVFTTEAAAIAAIKSGADRARRCDCADLRRPEGRRDAGDLPGHFGAEAVAALQACGGADGCAVQRSFDRRMHRTYLAGGAGGRTDRARCSKAIRSRL